MNRPEPALIAFALLLPAFALLPFSISLAGLFMLPALVAGCAGARRRDARPQPIYALMGLFLALTLLQTSWVADPGAHAGGWAKLYLLPFLIFWLVASQDLPGSARDLLLRVVVGAAALQAAFGIYEFAGGRLDWRLLPFTVNGVTEYALDLGLREVAPGRAHGIMLYPTLLSGLLLLAMPLAAGLAEYRARPIVRALPGAALLLMLLCLALTFTRSGWLAAPIALGAFALLARRWRVVALACTAVALCLVLALAARPGVVHQLQERAQSIGSLQDASNAQRLSIWRSYAAVVRDYFFVGAGINSGGVIFPRYRRPDFPGALINPHAHNWYLQAANESGVPLMLLFFAIVALPIRRAWAAPLEGDARVRRAAVTAAAIGFLLVNCLDYLAHDPRLNLTFWLCLALLYSDGKATPSPQPSPGGRGGFNGLVV